MLADIQQKIAELWENPQLRAALIVVAGIVAAYLVEFLFRRTLLVFAAKTKTDLDDKIFAAVRRPVFWTVILVAVRWSVPLVVLGNGGRFVIYGIIKTVIILAWTFASIGVVNAILAAMSARAKDDSIIQPRTLPVFDMLTKILVISAAAYFAFLAWKINVSAWLASAGIVGIAVGFAARDTLANLFAGIFLLADNIYKVGDFIVLNNDPALRGRVTRIGMRSTRILTQDDVEITVPNSLVGNATVVNEVGGPSIRQRIHINVSVAYGSDIDRVFEVLASVPEGVEEISNFPTPVVRFVNFGGSGLDFKLLVWITDPAARDAIASKLNALVYKALAAAKIEIPYEKRDLYIKEMPGVPGNKSPGAPGNKKPGNKTPDGE